MSISCTLNLKLINNTLKLPKVLLCESVTFFSKLDEPTSNTARLCSGQTANRDLTLSQSLTALGQVLEAHTKKLMNLLTGLIIYVGQGCSQSFNTISLTQSVKGPKPLQRPLALAQTEGLLC